MKLAPLFQIFLIVVGIHCSANILLANEREFASQTNLDGVYEFLDGEAIRIRAQGSISRERSIEVVRIKKFEIFVGESHVDSKAFDAILSEIIGVNLESITVSREFQGLSPKDVSVSYRMLIEYMVPANRPKDSTRIGASKVDITFDKKRVLSIKRDK